MDAKEDARTAEEDASVAAEEDARISCGRMRRTQDPCRGDGMESVIESPSENKHVPATTKWAHFKCQARTFPCLSQAGVSPA